MPETKSKLSPLKEVYCISCYAELFLDLSKRRGEKKIICSECGKSFTLTEAGKFLKSISPIVEGQCPACEGVLLFNMDDRVSKEKIECPLCKDSFYIYEVENPKTEKEIEKKKGNAKTTVDIYSILKHYYPDVRKTSDGYSVKTDTFNRKLFIILFLSIDIGMSLITSFIKMDSKRFRFTFEDWLVDFLGYVFIGWLLPSLVIAWIIARSSKGERKLSQNEIEESIKKYKSRK